jgi:hypothetical protein
MNDSLKSTTKTPFMGSLVYHFLAFPLGLLYFLVVVIGLSVGIGTIIIWVGLPILFATLLIMQVMAEIERRTVSSLLHLPRPLPQFVQAPKPGLLGKIGAMLRNPYSWTGMIYAFIKLPLGILSFTLVLTLPLVTLVTILGPLMYMTDLYIQTILAGNGITTQSDLIYGFITVTAHFDPVMFVRSFLLIPVGFVFLIATRYILIGLAQFSGLLAYALLGPGDSEVAVPHDAMPQYENGYQTVPTRVMEQQVYQNLG